MISFGNLTAEHAAAIARLKPAQNAKLAKLLDTTHVQVRGAVETVAIAEATVILDALLDEQEISRPGSSVERLDWFAREGTLQAQHSTIERVAAYARMMRAKAALLEHAIAVYHAFYPKALRRRAGWARHGIVQHMSNWIPAVGGSGRNFCEHDYSCMFCRVSLATVATRGSIQQRTWKPWSRHAEICAMRMLVGQLTPVPPP